MIGGATRVFVDQNGERVEFVTASAGKLANYIQQLEGQLGLSVGRRTRPIRFLF